ncbi:hypothetical protein RCL1_000163 [Eukaryota sp. TZLM3-RCL]
MPPRLRQSTLAFSSSGLSVKRARTSEQIWSSYESLGIKKPHNYCHYPKVAAFDFDGTLVTTASGSKFPKNAQDFEPRYSVVVSRLNKLGDEGFALVIFSNQNGISKGQTTETDVRERLDAFCNLIKHPILVLYATEGDQYRKPCPGMFIYYQKNVGTIDLETSFMVGDAAGRFKTQNHLSDFAASDRQFALNCGLKFFTPEEFFLNQDTSTDFDVGFDPKQVFSSYLETDLESNPDLSILSKDGPCLVVMIGSPGAGKSCFVSRYLVPLQITSVSLDKLKTRKALFSAINGKLDAGNSVVIDNTNPDPSTRRDFIELVMERKIPIYAIHLEGTKELAFHLNALRRCRGGRSVPPVAIHTYYKKLCPPTKDEGFSEVITWPFTPYFNSNDEKKEFFMLLT